MAVDAHAQWIRLGQYVIARRVALGHRTREAFAQYLGLSARLVSDIEKARRQSYDPGTLALLEQKLQWPAGAVQNVLSGGSAPIQDDLLFPDEPPGETPVGAGVDPDLLTDLTRATPDEVAKVKAYLRGILDSR